MAGPLGSVIRRASRLVRRKNAGFLLTTEGLPADVVSAVEILQEEQRDYLDEQRHRGEEVDAARREAAKHGVQSTR